MIAAHRIPVSVSGFEEYLRLQRQGDQDKAVAVLVEKVGLGAVKVEPEKIGRSL